MKYMIKWVHDLKNEYMSTNEYISTNEYMIKNWWTKNKGNMLVGMKGSEKSI